jgi:hypothetical protein
MEVRADCKEISQRLILGRSLIAGEDGKKEKTSPPPYKGGINFGLLSSAFLLFIIIFS